MTPTQARNRTVTAARDRRAAAAWPQVPPTINYETEDPECDLNYVPNKSISIEKPRAAISDNLGFGGHNAAIVFKAYEP